METKGFSFQYTGHRLPYTAAQKEIETIRAKYLVHDEDRAEPTHENIFDLTKLKQFLKIS